MDFNRIIVKPLSQNCAWQGRRFKTKEYIQYEKDCLIQLPTLRNLPKDNIRLTLIFGLSSKLSDVSNPIKLFEDILCKKYDFNDRYINELIVKKVMTDKGKEFIEFKIESLI